MLHVFINLQSGREKAGKKRYVMCRWRGIQNKMKEIVPGPCFETEQNLIIYV